MIKTNWLNGTVNIQSELTVDHMAVLQQALQSHVTEILTGPDNAPDKLELLSQVAESNGIDLDMSTDASLFEHPQ